MTEETFPGADERPADAEFGDSRIPGSELDRANAENGFGGAPVETADAAFNDVSAAFLGETAEAPDGVTAPDQLAAPDDGSSFLANLASAMKEAATAERTRVAEDVDRRRDAHLTGIETRRESEAGNIRNLADEDRTAIQTWVESEQQRINEERDRRTAALETDLEASLAEHGARIDAEKAQVEAAIATHRADLDAYFSKLEGETDPVAIAQQAGRRPAFPDLDAIGSEAAVAAETAGGGDRMIGVMASSRPTTKLSQAWAAWQASTATAETAAAATVPTSEPEPEAAAVAPAGAYVPPAVVDPQVNPVDPSPAPEPVAVAAGGGEPATDAEPTDSAAQTQSQSTFGGMSWLRRDKGNDQNR